MIRHFASALLTVTFTWSLVLSAEKKPYITTKVPPTLLSANDGETDILWRTAKEGLIDYESSNSATRVSSLPAAGPLAATYFAFQR